MIRNAVVAVFLLLTVASAQGCVATESPPPRSVVIWISIDGMRHDYVDRFNLPLLQRLMRDGAYSRQLAPVFPSLTFPSHASQITGVTVEAQGIPSNTFYDSATRQTYKFSDDAGLFQAEPIWVTAARQNVRSAVIDWPMSYAQSGRWRADYFNSKFEKDTTDAQRLAQLLDVWERDDPAQHDGQPLRLLIGYMAAVDSAGHDVGPDAPEMARALTTTDLLLEGFIARAQRIFRQKMREGDRLYFVLTTDHGMSPLHTQRILEDELGADLSAGLIITHSGNVASIHLDNIAQPDRSARSDALMRRLRALPHVRAWTRDALPAKWSYAHPTRSGDIVVVLDSGYAWKSKPKPTTKPTEEKSPPKGGHGWPVEDDPNMMGFMVIFSPQSKSGGEDLGRVDSLQLHPTVANLLGIEPARGAVFLPLSQGAWTGIKPPIAPTAASHR